MIQIRECTNRSFAIQWQKTIFGLDCKFEANVLFTCLGVSHSLYGVDCPWIYIPFLPLAYAFGRECYRIINFAITHIILRLKH